MHLISSQSLASGQVIGKCELYDQFFPLPFNERYIVFSPISKESKNYSFWQNVLSIILPYLNENDIKIIQVGAANEKAYNGCVHLMGQTTLNNVFYLIKNSIGLLSTDTFTQHVADGYGVKSTVIVSNNYAQNVCGYFHPENQIIIEPPYEDGQRPCLSLQDPLKMVDKITPEKVAAAVCKMLNITFNWPYSTLYMGEISTVNMLISAMDSLIDPKNLGVGQMICDLTLNFDENILANQLNLGDCSIISNKPINLELIKQFKSRIKEIVYIVESKENSLPTFITSCQRLGIGCKVLSSLDDSVLNDLKFDWLDTAIIFKKPVYMMSSAPELKNKDINSLYIRSSKFYIGRNKLYNSRAGYILDKPVSNFDEITPVIDNADFWGEIDSFHILEKINVPAN